MKKWLKNRLEKIFPGIYTEETINNVVNNPTDNGALSSKVEYKKFLFGAKIKHSKKTVTQEYKTQAKEEKNEEEKKEERKIIKGFKNNK